MEVVRYVTDDQVYVDSSCAHLKWYDIHVALFGDGILMCPYSVNKIAYFLYHLRISSTLLAAATWYLVDWHVYALLHWSSYRYLLQFTRPKNAGLSCNPLHSYLDVNARNASGATALELSVCHGHMAVTRLLLDFGAAATLPDASGRLLCSPSFSGVQFLLDSRRSEQMSE